MSKFKDEIAEKLFEHLDKHLSYEVKSILTPSLVTEVIYHTADFIELQRLNDIFDNAIKLHKALLNVNEREVTEEEPQGFMGDLKKL